MGWIWSRAVFHELTKCDKKKIALHALYRRNHPVMKLMFYAFEFIQFQSNHEISQAMRACMSAKAPSIWQMSFYGSNVHLPRVLTRKSVDFIRPRHITSPRKSAKFLQHRFEKVEKDWFKGLAIFPSCWTCPCWVLNLEIDQLCWSTEIPFSLLEWIIHKSEEGK